jgi:ubiquinone biosynthesis protein
MSELDFRLEAQNMHRFAENFRDSKTVHVPEVHKEFSTKRVITMDFVSGEGISEINALEEGGYDLSEIAHNCADAWIKSIFEYGFFHADPHPGNIMVMPDNSIYLLDYGMMGSVSNNQREKLSWLMYFISRQDEKRATRALLDLAVPLDRVNMRNLEIKMGKLIANYARLPMNELHFNTLVSDLFTLLKENKLKFDTYIIWLLKAASSGEDIARRLEADFNFVEYSRPYVKSAIKQSLNPYEQLKELNFTAMDLMGLIRDLPYETKRLLTQITEGRLKIEFEHAGLEPFRKTLNKITNRLAISIILASLLIGSSLIVLAGLPPLIGEMPVIGLAGYIISGIFGLILVVSIIRSG